MCPRYARGIIQPPAGFLVCYRFESAQQNKAGRVVHRPRSGVSGTSPDTRPVMASAFRSPSLFICSAAPYLRTCVRAPTLRCPRTVYGVDRPRCTQGVPPSPLRAPSSLRSDPRRVSGATGERYPAPSGWDFLSADAYVFKRCVLSAFVRPLLRFVRCVLSLRLRPPHRF